jgi:hypothetical protein
MSSSSPPNEQINAPSRRIVAIPDARSCARGTTWGSLRLSPSSVRFRKTGQAAIMDGCFMERASVRARAATGTAVSASATQPYIKITCREEVQQRVRRRIVEDFRFRILQPDQGCAVSSQGQPQRQVDTGNEAFMAATPEGMAAPESRILMLSAPHTDATQTRLERRTYITTLFIKSIFPRWPEAATRAAAKQTVAPVSLMNSQELSSSHARAWAIASSYESERPSDSAAANAMAPNASRARSINTSSPGSG